MLDGELIANRIVDVSPPAEQPEGLEDQGIGPGAYTGITPFRPPQCRTDHPGTLGNKFLRQPTPEAGFSEARPELAQFAFHGGGSRDLRRHDGNHDYRMA